MSKGRQFQEIPKQQAKSWTLHRS